MNIKNIMIAGPCAAESREQILTSIEQAKNRSVNFLRISLWKPRTRPGFDGLGEQGISLLVEAAKENVHPATEVLVADHAKKIIDEVLSCSGKSNVLVWIGARNQNHFVQREIARVVATSSRAFLLVKNQPWQSQSHWEGIIDHVLDGGVSKNNLLLCHRGFTPQGDNPANYRSVPDFDMAMEVKEKTGLPMIFDPSHTGGSVHNVMKIAQEASSYSFDGMIVEVHPEPHKALTDAAQQLTWEQFDKLVQHLALEKVQKLIDQMNTTQAKSLEDFRRGIDMIDDALLELLAKRMNIVRGIGEYKKDNAIIPLDEERWNIILDSLLSKSERIGVPQPLIKKIYELIHEHSLQMQQSLQLR